MKNRIETKFRELRRQRKKAFIAFITAGDPNLKTTQKLVLAFEKAGVDIVELGVPFSDPMADGPVIQASSFRSLQKGTSLKKILKTVKQIRLHSQIPVVLMTYYNPVFCFGEERFVKAACEAGVDGVIIPDLPLEEAAAFRKSAQKENLATIFFLSSTTTRPRVKEIISASTGFIYYLSLTGVTGTRKTLSTTFIKDVKLAKRLTDKPVCVGFGVSKHSQVKAIQAVADGVIVGSAIVSQIAKHAGEKNLVNRVAGFVSRLSGKSR